MKHTVKLVRFIAKNGLEAFPLGPEITVVELTTGIVVTRGDDRNPRKNQENATQDLVRLVGILG